MNGKIVIVDDFSIIIIVITSVLIVLIIAVVIIAICHRGNDSQPIDRNRYLPKPTNDKESISYSDYIGILGENSIDAILQDIKDEIGGEIYKNLILEDIYHNYTEIDHIYVSECGVFIIETKSWAGKVYGGDRDSKWEIVQGNGSIIHHKENPFLQNDRHVSFFERVVHPGCDITPVVVFIDSKLEYIECKSVILSSALKEYLLKHDYQVIDENEYNFIIGRLNYYRDNPPMTHEEYIRWQKAKFKK